MMNKERELLRRATDALRSELGPVPPYYIYGLIQEMEEEYLYPEPESDEPVAWSVFDGEGGYDYISYENNETYKDEFISRNRAEHYKEWVQPLYTRPEPERKPIPIDQIDKAYENTLYLDGYFAFGAGVRFAERHHGIGGES